MISYSHECKTCDCQYRRKDATEKLFVVPNWKEQEMALSPLIWASIEYNESEVVKSIIRKRHVLIDHLRFMQTQEVTAYRASEKPPK